MYGGGACMAGGIHGRGMHGGGVCVVGGVYGGGMRGGGHVWQGACMARGHAWQRGGMHGGGGVWQILRDTVNEQVVRILLECIVVFKLWMDIVAIGITF